MFKLESKVWDSEEKEWNPDRHAILPDGSLMFDCADREWQTPADPDRFKLCLSTGLKDSNGNMIFQDDIVSYEGANHVVEYQLNRDYPAFDLEPPICEEVNSLSMAVCDFPRLEVVGNIHENPELIGG